MELMFSTQSAFRFVDANGKQLENVDVDRGLCGPHSLYPSRVFSTKISVRVLELKLSQLNRVGLEEAKTKDNCDFQDSSTKNRL
jgi:hypothetical protein